MLNSAGSDRHMLHLLQCLPQLPMTPQREIDYPAADPALLVAVAVDAEPTMNVVHLGVGAIGQLLAGSGVDNEDGTIDAACIESLGNLIAELGALASGCMALAARCRHETVDYTPR